MDEFLKLNWAWSNAREASHPQHYEASFEDQPLDPFYGHLNEMRHFNLLFAADCEAPATFAGISGVSRHIDPRTGANVDHLYVDMTTTTTATKPKTPAIVPPPPASESAERGAAAGGQDQPSTSAASAASAASSSSSVLSASPPQPLPPHNLLLLRDLFGLFHQVQVSKRAQLLPVQRRMAAYFGYVREQYGLLVQRQLCDLRPFRSDAAEAGWRRRVAETRQRFDGQAYAIRTAIMLNGATAAMPRMAVDEGALLQCGSRVPRYGRTMAGRPAGSRPYVAGPTSRLFGGAAGMHSRLQRFVGGTDVRMLMDVRVVRQLVDWPANASAQWTIPFEMRELEAGQMCCVFDWSVLPEAVLQPRWLHRVALRQQLVERNLYVLADGEEEAEAAAAGGCTTNLDLDRLYSAHRFHDYLQLKHSNQPEQQQQQQQQQQHKPYACFARILTLRPEEEEEEEAGAGAGRSAHQLQPIQLLVDCAVDGIEGDGRDANWTSAPNGMPHAVHISVKPEYRLEAQTERMTESELIDEWCRHFVCPGAVTDRYRMNVNTGTILSVVRLTRADIEREMSDLYGLTANTLLQRLYSFANAIQHFPSQKYWLCHSPEDPTVRVYSLADEGSAIAPACRMDIKHLDTVRIGTDEFVCLPIADSIMKRIYKRTVDQSTAQQND